MRVYPDYSDRMLLVHITEICYYGVAFIMNNYHIFEQVVVYLFEPCECQIH